jgi:polyisoprenoid-binding protein YceI
MRRAPAFAAAVSAFVAAAVVAFAAGAAHAADADYRLDAAASTVKYKLVHKLHEFEGTSHKAEGRARVLDGGRAQVMLRVPVESFDSSNVNRDAHMKETVEAARYPDVELKAIGDGLNAPATFPSKLAKTFKVQLTFHGVQQLFEVPVTIEWVSANELRAQATFRLSLESYKIDRPSLMFVKVDDDMKIDAKLVFKK